MLVKHYFICFDYFQATYNFRFNVKYVWFCDPALLGYMFVLEFLCEKVNCIQ